MCQTEASPLFFEVQSRVELFIVVFGHVLRLSSGIPACMTVILPW